MKGNRINHPSKRPPYKPDSPKRTIRYSFAITPEDMQRIRDYAEQHNISRNDAISEAIKRL